MAYLERYDLANNPRFWRDVGLPERDLAAIRPSISHGIIALDQRGRTIATRP